MRIKTIVKMVDKADILLDIGTDHGKVIIEALKTGIINKAIATDINKGPLQRAFNNVKNAGFLSKVTFIQTNGFKNINLNYDGVVITGLGYHTVKEILSEPHQEPKFYVFGVQSEIEEFREFLSENGYSIIAEEIVLEKKIYILIKATIGQRTLSKEEIILGPFLKNNKKAIPYYREKIQNLEEKMPFLKNSELNIAKDKLDIYKKAINNLV